MAQPGLGARPLMKSFLFAVIVIVFTRMAYPDEILPVDPKTPLLEINPNSRPLPKRRSGLSNLTPLAHPRENRSKNARHALSDNPGKRHFRGERFVETKMHPPATRETAATTTANDLE